MFLNREEAGIKLASIVSLEKEFKNAVVISIPRGGVIVGDAVSRILHIPHYPLVVKKIGAPNNPELAIGATGFDGVVFWDEEIIGNLDITRKERNESLAQTVKTIQERERSLSIKSPKVRQKTAIVVDDGVATGSTAIAASLILKKMGASKVILATPLISKNTKQEILEYFDKIISVETPKRLGAVGEFYQEFPEVSDEEAREILNIKYTPIH